MAAAAATKADRLRNGFRTCIDVVTRSYLDTIEPSTAETGLIRSLKAEDFRNRGGGTAHDDLLASARRLDGGVSDDPFTRHHTEVEMRLVAALAGWRRKVGVDEIRVLLAALERDAARLGRIPTERAAALAAVRATDPAAAVAALRVARIADVRLPGLGAGRIALLARHGLLSAADISRSRIRSIAGIGGWCAASLLIWRDEVEASSLVSALSPGRLQGLRDIVVQRFDALERDLIRCLQVERAALQKAVHRLQALASIQDETVALARLEVAHAVADMRFLGLPLPGEARVQVKPIAKAKARKRGKVKAVVAKGCPACGGPMVRRWSAGGRGGAAFMGCAAYPRCTGRLPVSRNTR